MSAQSSKPKMEHFLKEWEIARSVLDNFDQRLHDLRKVGFTFITALLAGDAIIFKDFFISEVQLDEKVKFSILIIEFGFIIALLLLDRTYRVFQEAASTRAKVIERKINLELTEIIAQRYDFTNVPDYITGLYWGFTAMVLLMGFTVLSGMLKYQLLIIWIVVFVVIYIINYTKLYPLVKLKFPFESGELDWTLDPLQCIKEEQVEITVNNLGEEPILFEKNTIMWKILKEDDGSCVASGGAENRDISIGKEDSFTWLWKPENSGVYRVHGIALDKTKEPNTWSKFQLELGKKKEPKSWSKFRLLQRKLIVRNEKNAS